MTAAMERTDEHRRRAIAEFVRDRAAALDRGETDTRTDLARIGELGLLDAGLESGELRDMVVVIEDIAAESLAVGFSLWAQRMTLEYIDRGPATLRTRFRDDLCAGRQVGVTAMAAAMKHLAGLGELSLTAEHTPDGLEVSGPIHWASNVFDDALIVFPARTADGGGIVAAVRADTPGIRINPRPDLLALGATASTSLTFERVHVPADQIVTGELHSFCGAIRPTFLLLQTSFCVGISRTALDESDSRITGLGAQFVDEYRSLRDRFGNLRDRLHEYAAAPASVDPADLLRLRLDGSLVAVDATRLESTLRGGAGYASASATNRRFREAAFLPIQSPSEGQLRWELSQYE